MFFVWMLIFNYVPFRHFLYWTYDTAYKCHAAVSSECGPVQPGELKGISPYHILFDYTFNFNLLGFDILHTDMWGGETVLANATMARGAF